MNDFQSQDSVRMDTDLESILERCARIAVEDIAPEAERIDREAIWPGKGLKALQEAGLGGLVIPKKSGGLGQGLSGLARVCELIGRECTSTGLCFGMHCVGSAVIAAKATGGQAHYLRAINEGRHLTTLALSEPGTGIHFYFPESQLIPNSDGSFSVSGRKHFVTNGGHADSYVVSTVAADSKAPPNQFSFVVIPKAAEGLQWGEPWKGMGLRGNQSRSVELKEIKIEAENLLGEKGDQIWYIFNIVAPYFLIAMAGTYLGLAEAALDEARRHLGSREYSHSGTTLGEASILQHRLGNLWSRVERTRHLIYWAAREADQGGPDALPALCAAKAEVADCAVNAVNDAMTLCGGIAYRENSKLNRLLRDARAAHIMAPTTDILLTWAGRSLLGQPILGD